MEVLTMGGYGAYVWPAYAVAAVMLLGVAAVSWRGLRRAQGRLRELQAEAAGGDEA